MNIVALLDKFSCLVFFGKSKRDKLEDEFFVVEGFAD
jgi:hypothetical protein